MQNKLKYRVGLKLNDNSIGWCLLRLDKNDNATSIIKMGVRAFHNSRDPKSNDPLFYKRNNLKNKRKNNDRSIKRKQRLIKTLVDLSFLPTCEIERKELIKLDPYPLRYKGLYEKLLPHEFARIVLHLSDKRGFALSKSKVNPINKKNNIYRSIANLNSYLETGEYLSVGEFLAKLHEQKISLKQGSKNEKDILISRNMIENEFEQIWKKQKHLNKILYTKKAHKAVKETLFFQRDIHKNKKKKNNVKENDKLHGKNKKLIPYNSDWNQLFDKKKSNPTIHVLANQLRKVINEIITKYGDPSEISLSINHVLEENWKPNKVCEKKKKIRNAQDIKFLEKISKLMGTEAEEISDIEKKKIIQKILLWEELNPQDEKNRFCPISGKRITLKTLLKDKIQIDYILPFHKTFDDSLNNKTILFHDEYVKKGVRHFLEIESLNRNVEEYSKVLKRLENLPSNKIIRFQKNALDNYHRKIKSLKILFLNADTSISIFLKAYLKNIISADRIFIIPYNTSSKINEALKLYNYGNNYFDYRIEAIDASVAAFINYKYLEKYSEKFYCERLSGKDIWSIIPPDPWIHFKDNINNAFNNIYVSHKPDHGYQGALHLETAWHPISDGYATKYDREPSSNNRILIKKKQSLILIRDKQQTKRHGIDLLGFPKAYKGYINGGNYCLEIWIDDKGKWQGNIISTFIAYQVIRLHGEEQGLNKLSNKQFALNGKKLVMRIMKNDYIQLSENNSNIIARVARFYKPRTNPDIMLAEHFECNTDKRYSKSEFSYIIKSVKSLQKANAKKLTVSVLGVKRIFKTNA